MSAYREDYIGPYMVVMNITGSTKNTKLVCNTVECVGKNIGTSKFCPNCGSQLVFKEVETILDAEYLLDKYDENYHEILYVVHAGGGPIYNDRSIVIPNGTGDIPGYINIDSDFCGDVDLTKAADIMPGQIEWFNIEYKEILDYLRGHGVDVSVKWGMVVHYN